MATALGKPEAIEEQRWLIWRERVSGKTYRAIGQLYGLTQREVAAHVKAVAEELHAITLDNAALHREAELEALDIAKQAIYGAVQAGDGAAIDRWIKLSQERRKLLGIDAPAAMTMTHEAGLTWRDVVEQAKAAIHAASPDTSRSD